MRRKIKIPTILKYAAFLGATCTVLATGFDYVWNRNYLDQKEFENVEWAEIDNKDGIIWDNYLNAEIPHNQWNWAAYDEEVTKKNKGKLEGKILIPNFDR